MSRMSAPVSAVAALALSCAPNSNGGLSADSGAAAPSCDSATHSEVYVVRQLGFARTSDSGVAWGFDLDGHVSAAGDPDGCGKADRTDPLGNPGIDNAFSGLVPVLEQTEAAAAEGLLQDSINAGELLLLLEVTGIDDATNDDCVTVRLGQGEGVPLIGTDGTLLDGQTFAPTPGIEPTVATAAWIEDGVLHARGLGLVLELQILDAELAVPITDAGFRLELDPGAPVLTGQFGGGLPVDEFLEVAANNGIAQSLRDLLNTALPVAADLKMDDGTCGLLSAGFELEVSPAFLADE